MTQMNTLWPPSDGEMAGRIRMHDWTATSLGPMTAWSERLKVMVELMLANPQVSSLVCGPQRTLIYNDAAAGLYGHQHPAALGRPLPETFSEGWVTVAPFYERAFAGETVHVAAQPVDTRGEGEATDVFDALLIPLREGDGDVAYVHMTGYEVGERLLAEATLRESDTRHRLLIESWAQAVWETDADGVVVTDSPSWRAYTGQSLDEWLGYGWLDAIHPDDWAYAERQWREATAARGLVNAEFRLRAPDGGWRWTNVRAAPVLDESGRIEKWAGINIDIDTRERAEAALRESEEKYRLLFESMDEAYAVVEVLKNEAGSWSDFRFIEVNPAFLKHTSMPWPVGQTAIELLGEPNPRWTELYGQTLDTGEPIRVEESEPTLGRVFDLNIFALDRERNRVAVLFTDITGRKQAEAALRESESLRRVALDGGGMGAWTWDTRANTVRADEVVQRLSGVSIDGQPHAVSLYADLMFPEGASWLAAVAAKAMAPDEEFQTQVQVASGATSGRWVELRGRAEHAKPWIINGVSFDITEQRLAEHRLSESEERLRTLTEGIPQLVWRSADAGHWTWSSSQWQAFTGQSLEVSLGRGWLDALHPDDRRIALQAWDAAPSESVIDVEYRVRRAADGAYLWHHTRSLPVRSDDGSVIEWLGTSTDVDDLRAYQERQAVLVSELQHRTRNLMGVVRTMADKTLRRSADLADFEARYIDRLAALARVQGLLSRLAEGQRIAFDELIQAEMAALNGSADRATLMGPKGVALRSSTVQTFALALHELATNAVKYGAFAQSQGRLEIRWWLERAKNDGRPWLNVDWRERDVVMPTVETPVQGGGSGRELIERALPYQLGATTTYVMEADGVHCTIALPVSGRQLLKVSADA